MFLNARTWIHASQIKASRLASDPGFVWIAFNDTCSVAFDAAELQTLLAEGQRELNALIADARTRQVAA